MSRRLPNGKAPSPERDGIGLDRRVLDRARLSRDARFDGKFFIAVITTGIYCRPVCPVAGPKPNHVRYYRSAAAAAEAGFRPCLRCRPEAAPGTPAWLGTSVVVRRALHLIEDGFLDHGSVPGLASRLGMGSRQLHRLFVRHVGASPIAVAQTRRLHFAKRLLDETSLPIREIAAAAGFGSLRRLHHAFRQAYRRTPGELRRGPRRGHAPAPEDALVLRLAFRPPYDWRQVSAFLAMRAVPGIERVDARGYARTVLTCSGPAVVCVRAIEARNVLELSVRGAAPAALFPLTSAARRAFDLAADPASIAEAFEADALLGPLVRRRPGLRIPGIWDPFECAVRAVLGQQVSVAAARTLAARVVARAGRRLAEASEDLTHLFPDAAALAAAELEGLGLTGARVAALRLLARAVVEGRLDLSAPVEEIKASLAGLAGFGDWTAQYVALRAMGEPDAFPSGDIVLRRVAGKGLPLTTRALEQLAEAWRPWRGYAALYLWGAAGDRGLTLRSSGTDRVAEREEAGRASSLHADHRGCRA